MSESFAPGWPGSPGRWTSAAKSGVGTALEGSPIWFTLSHGILNEIYAPRIDEAATRDVGFLVAGPGGFISEIKRHARHATRCPQAGVPYYETRSECLQARFALQCEFITDVSRPVVLVRVKFEALRGNPADYRLYVLVAPHLGNFGAGNTAWAGEYREVPALFAARADRALCLMSASGFAARSVGFVGSSDGWQDLMAHGEMQWHYTRAENGNVALIAEVPLPEGETVIALAVGRGADEAGHLARASLAEGFPALLDRYVAPWQRWHAARAGAAPGALSVVSAAVIRAHESKLIPGALLASLAVPWGFSKGDDDLGGYHLVWPRDMVQSVGGLLAAGACGDARTSLVFLAATQHADGHWPQNMWVDGSVYWQGLQMDETALPILLFDLAAREGALLEEDFAQRRFWPMVRAAAGYIVRNGPVTPQDRWEETAGYTPFTLAAEIAALLVAADWAERCGEPALAPYLRDTADSWNSQIEHWLYVRDTPLARRCGVEGYYVRVAETDLEDGDDYVDIRNHEVADTHRRADEIVSADALALVRMGLRAADDPRIVNTVKVIDATLKADLPMGPGWHRYTDDGYGEHADGSPFDGTGIGRVWPLLSGERAHYALALGDVATARALLASFEAMAGEGGLLPEQTWDAADRPDRELYFGRPAGSAMPLVWAHAEYLKLVHSLADGCVFDMPPQTRARYLSGLKKSSTLRIWRFNQKIRSIAAGCVLRIETTAPAHVRYSTDAWHSLSEAVTQLTGFGVHFLDLPTASLPAGTSVIFTCYWPETNHWEGIDFRVQVVDA
jgi:glucoamylase